MVIMAGEKNGNSNGNSDLLKIINEAITGKAKANRRYIDEILEQVQRRNHDYFITRYNQEVEKMVEAEKKGDLQSVVHHKTLADVYKSIIDRCFTS